jgi:intracellular sulfur oxidation DsrE/DsrF family protein
MKALATVLVLLLVPGCASVSPNSPRLQDTGVAQAAVPNEMRVAFDVTEGNPKVLLAKLASVDLTRKQLIDHGITPKIVLAFHGDASYFTQTDMSLVKEGDRADAARVQAKIRELRAASGVEGVEQCTIPLASRKISTANLMQEVKLVPNAWISLAEYQQKGYSYIVP